MKYLKFTASLIAFSLLITLLSGCGAAPATVPTAPPAAAPSGEQEAVISEAPVEDAPENTIPEAYRAILDKYVLAVSEEWNAGQLMEEELNILSTYCYEGEPTENIGYLVHDLDGDGVPESVRPQMETIDWEESLQLLVMTEELPYYYDTYILYVKGVYAADLDGDGVTEILLCGDEASADYFTTCLKFDPKHGLQPIPFADANRGENTDEYFDSGYGRIISIDGNVLTLLGSQDALGTWWCTREFTLRDGQFELDDGGVWRVAVDTEDPEVWEYLSLTLIREMEITLEDGSAATLSPGESFVVTETDKVSFVGFQTLSGMRGTIPVEFDEEEGWGFKIHGINEYEYFDYIPYSD